MATTVVVSHVESRDECMGDRERSTYSQEVRRISELGAGNFHDDAVSSGKSGESGVASSSDTRIELIVNLNRKA